MSFIKLLEYMAGMMSMKTHLKGVLSFSGVFDLDFSFIVGIWNDLQKGSGSTLRLISYQKFTVYPAISYLLYLCTNLWYNNPRENLFLGICFCDFDFSFVFTKNSCFAVHFVVMSHSYVHFQWIKPCKTIDSKGMYVQN